MITKQNLFSIPIFKLGFELEPFKVHLESFLSDINKGKDLDVKKIIHDLIFMTTELSGYSRSFLTVSFDFAWAVLQAHPSLWNQQEIANKRSQLSDHWLEFFPEDDGTFDDFDVATLDLAQYFVFAMNMLQDNDVNEEERPMFSYAAYIFFKNQEVDYTEFEIKELFENMNLEEN